MKFSKEDKFRIAYGTLIGLVIYFILSVFVKLLGYDVFSITDDMPLLSKLNDFVMSNIFLEDFVNSLMFIINLMFVYGICGRIFNWKQIFILCGISFPIVYGVNLLIYYFEFSSLFLSIVFPLIVLLIYSVIYTNYCLFRSSTLNRKLNSMLTTIILYCCLSLFMVVIQQIILFLKFTIFKFSYINTNIFNSILLSFEIWGIYFLIYQCCKIINKGEENDGLQLVVLLRFQKLERKDKEENQIDLNFRQKLIYFGMLGSVQLFQLAGVVLISIINKALYEFIGIYLGLIMGRIIFGKGWHAKTIFICSFLTFTVFFFLTRGSLPSDVSISCSYLLGIILAFILYIFAELEEKVDTRICIKEEIGNTKVDLRNLSIEEIRDLCTKNCFSETDTNFLIDFIKNPKGLKKYEIAIKYNYERSYIYQRAKKLIKILEG